MQQHGWVDKQFMINKLVRFCTLHLAIQQKHLPDTASSISMDLPVFGVVASADVNAYLAKGTTADQFHSLKFACSTVQHLLDFYAPFQVFLDLFLQLQQQ